MSTAGTKFTYPPSNASFTINQQRMPPPSYIEPPSFEATLRACDRSASMSALEKHMIGSAGECIIHSTAYFDVKSAYEK